MRTAQPRAPRKDHIKPLLCKAFSSLSPEERAKLTKWSRRLDHSLNRAFAHAVNAIQTDNEETRSERLSALFREIATSFLELGKLPKR